MAHSVKAQLNAQGIQLPEEDYEYLETFASAFARMRSAAEKEALNDFNMQLLMIPDRLTSERQSE
ncbi:MULTISPECIES: hypothetical protein [unclassified Paenibacillus]|uniref:hypothetical protein n=1 Tax=unclassified Paenibacillus TaxID=185978 RepID=UPI002405BE3B|nr:MULTISPECIES: hypothetical protein [unclassified Paenibacillus]MDF9839775.1 hypothetical protein [Paenibacillus sp. PastF-2]MDF9846355.1 hypothetical protein [Paenibacillus sp. PastM-2]MDF9853295.1 hypothetical protein [Paenibacillus sp. PastF-1]MDH6478201.1 hypothetical protein [Paenibacillus sp. PastH-2]MDH6506300.1 hypothetical protein [Paenibacillus sp. PastM-3]